ncbi:LOW QUALITY PROTEIN: zinc carboxypeptidase [Drosophila obscura]|uniref:LOW QUALITY PROTEIN: zinc carboxypeptidase n=1 Tax=Drosophila obscura TaxID=7282 RepID=UPI001BB0F5A7|nr:LOW QUALITY PROTEIN: zinc carboxypeptidase [Drosophila obscura]
MRLLWLCAAAAALLLVLASAGTLKDSPTKERYDHYEVYRLTLRNRLQLDVIERLAELSNKYNIWKDYDAHSQELHIMVSPEDLQHFQQLLRVHGIGSEQMVANVQALIDEEQVTAAADTAASDGTFGWTKYYELAEIEAWLDSVLAAYPNVTEQFIVGQSYENRTIRGIKISHQAGNPGIFIESNIHAREWITSASATWFINQLLTSEEPAVRNLAESYDWHIVPVFNVDGFEYSHTKNRMWRKTRQPHATSECIGADANRNFDSHWMVNNGASANPCSETFAGDVPGSEPEARALAEYLSSIQDQFSVYISFHSYGQYLLSPFGHTAAEFPDNYDDLLQIGAAFATAIEELPYGTVYTYGSTADVLYVATGTSVDWVFNELQKKIGYTIEYRDKGRYGFILPPVQILPNCQELMAGMLALIDKTKQLGYI